MTLPSYFSIPEAADALAVRKAAEELYRTAQFNCSEAVMKAVRDYFCPEIPDYVIAMSSGFPVGMGGAGCTCGAAAGGVMVLGLIFGREKPLQFVQSGHTMRLAKELHDRFKEMNQTLCCRIHTKDMQIGSPEHSAQCTRFTGDAAQITAEIIIREATK